jgi:hypothetical protein
MKKYLNGALAALLVAVALGGATELAAKPLNAGKTGFKSNAGVGNGTEDVQVGEPTTVVTTSTQTSTTTDTVTGDPVVVSTVTTTQEISRVVAGPDTKVGNSGNFKRPYYVTYETTTTTGTETVVTTNTYLVTEVYKTTTTTTDMADVDPGNSQSHNQAPEGQPADIVVSDTQLDSTSTELTGSTSETVSETTTSDPVTSVVQENVLCNGSSGQNEGTNYCN